MTVLQRLMVNGFIINLYQPVPRPVQMLQKEDLAAVSGKKIISIVYLCPVKKL